MKFRIVSLAALVCWSLTGAVTNLPKTAAGLVANVHDLNGAGCKTCHAPHNGSNPSNPALDATGPYLLWATSWSSVTAFGTYASNSMNSGIGVSATDIAGAPTSITNPDVKLYSMLCMSCHDGVTGTASFSTINSGAGMLPANKVGSVSGSQGLTNDHPVNVPYSTAKDGRLNTPDANNAVNGMPLYGATGSLNVQCSTCHDPHNDFFGTPTAGSATGTSNTTTKTFFLRTVNDSTHCTSCHN